MLNSYFKYFCKLCTYFFTVQYFFPSYNKNNNDKNNNNETLIKRPFPRVQRRYLKLKFKTYNHRCIDIYIDIHWSIDSLIFTLVDPLIFTNWVRSSKYNRNHSNALPPIPNRRERRKSKIQWSTVSNAAERSRSSKITYLFWSEAIAISLWTRIKAVSVLWSFLNADWYKTSTPLASK